MVEADEADEGQLKEGDQVVRAQLTIKRRNAVWQDRKCDQPQQKPYASEMGDQSPQTA